ncbi:hypothetical protein A0H81_06706 [Grifola frondosa]|uniref:Uncharacterized protein n=1 Tax=Grifola frondosa TaxID=5627 RepID=A0A1C7M7K3_GRIFR|nr:hypothetical protein A0H81_06706 [Grifola frondosa]
MLPSSSDGVPLSATIVQSTTNVPLMDPDPPAKVPPAQTTDRPPGGTRRSGTKTPRKVQWVFDDDAEASTSSRGLDEHGLDRSRR